MYFNDEQWEEVLKAQKELNDQLKKMQETVDSMCRDSVSALETINHVITLDDKYSCISGHVGCDDTKGINDDGNCTNCGAIENK